MRNSRLSSKRKRDLVSKGRCSREACIAASLWFHAKPTTQDVDNIAKNVLDGMKSVVFGDDIAIVRCFLAKIDVREDYALDPEFVTSDEYTLLMGHLDGGEDNVLYVEVGQTTGQWMRRGPIEESHS
jgi:hypothetical protein